MQKRLNKKRSSSWIKWLLILLLLFFLLFLLYRLFLSENPGNRKSKDIISSDSSIVNTQNSDSTLFCSDSIQPKDSVSTDSNYNIATVNTDTAQKTKVINRTRTVSVKKDSSVKHDVAIPVTDTLDTDSVKDSSELLLDPCAQDTSELWVYPDPSGGLHRNAVTVMLVSNRNCQVRYRFAGEKDWKEYQNQPVSVATTGILQFDAIDSCGRQMVMREEYYEIETLSKSSQCPSGMEYVFVGNTKFCIDRYEWPNRKGVLPKAYISLYQAMDSCYSVGKRLCTSDEWTLACSGPHTWSYPYGQIYERYACVTHDQKSPFSGSRPECRSFFGVYDMSGSLLEWTSTKVENNRQFFYVMGGFWESGPQSGCFDKRYSYFPENQHNPVGFRCCSDINEQSDKQVKNSRKGRGH